MLARERIGREDGLQARGTTPEFSGALGRNARWRYRIHDRARACFIRYKGGGVSEFQEFCSKRSVSPIMLTKDRILRETHRTLTRGSRPHGVRSGRDRRDSCSLQRPGCIRRALRPMKTEDRRVCAGCGNEFSGAVAFCPVCMLRKALAGEVESGESFAEGAVGPTSKDVTQRFEHYELMSDKDGKPVELGRGAMGVTYKAFDVDLRCPVTLKVISQLYLGDESARLRFLREARAAASVRHPNVASVFHLGKNRRELFLRDGVFGGGNAREPRQTHGPA